MCGRVRDPEEHSEIKIRIDKYYLEPRERRTNVPPTSDVPVVTSPEGMRTLEPMRWGIIPPWAKDMKIGYSTFNARADGVTTKPAFRGAWRAGQRCLVLTGGFYEWRKPDKQPFAVSLGNRGVMPMAGLWECWNGPEGPVKSCTIITTEANEMMAEIHDRMPVILDANDWPAWLGEEEATADQLLAMLRPFPAGRMILWPVSRDVGNVKNTGPELEEPIRL
ncbi:MAG: SOS response-associated peptidase [Bradyrhizobium sp.]|uniref:SOS response-associated peptidase n=1 Tax=Bradyrhizobium sp. TaxID=376 RepID=UPI003D0D490B